MKKLLFTIISSVLLALMLASCSEEIDPGEPIHIYNTNGTMIYDGCFYFSTENGLRYYDLSDTESGSYPVVANAISSGTEKISFGGIYYVIDPWQTTKNGGQHHRRENGTAEGIIEEPDIFN